MRSIFSALCAMFVALVWTSSSQALSITYAGSSGSLSASALFTLSGSTLQVTLTNTSSADILVPADVWWCPSIACMAANTAPTRLWPMVESDAAYVSGCPPCGRARFRLDMAVQSSRYAQRSRMTPSRGGPSPKVIPCGAAARTSRSIWTQSVLSRCSRLSVRHLVYYHSAI